MTIYWTKLLVVVVLVSAIVLLSIFGKDMHPAVLPMLLGGLGTALAFLQSPTNNAKTTIAPPPMPPEDK
jgi:hypothetical protein